MRIVSNLLILCLSTFNLIIRCQTFYNEGYLLDETGLSPIDIYGTDVLAHAQWLSLLFNFVMIGLALFNLYTNFNDFYKSKTV